MIETRNLTKVFHGDQPVKAVNNVSVTMKDQEIFGLVGTNGAGKSTLLRLLAGVLRQDEGMILIDHQNVFDNPDVKKTLFFVPGEPFFLPNSSARAMAAYSREVWTGFDKLRFLKLCGEFGLDPDRRIAEYSKGMKRQLSILLAVCANTHYVLLDETFDGLDPVMRQAVKSLFAAEMADRGLTPVLTSHNLREIEDICDHVGLLHQGGILLSEDLEDMKLGIQKVQAVFGQEESRLAVKNALSVIEETRTGRLSTFTIRGTREQVEAYFRGADTVYFEILPLTLEEIFISETEATGYDIRRVLMKEAQA